MRFKWPLVVCGAVALTICIAWVAGEHSWRVGFIPRALGVSRIIYAAEKVFGLGPGGNEAGIVVYELPGAAAVAVSRGGVSYLESLPGEGRSLYRNWQATPLKPPVRVFDRVLGSSDVCDVVCAGPETPGAHVDPKIVSQVNRSLGQPGSYYASGRNGLLVISPASRRVIFAYAK